MEAEDRSRFKIDHVEQYSVSGGIQNGNLEIDVDDDALKSTIAIAEIRGTSNACLSQCANPLATQP
jgi:hypothetical protein